MKLSLLSFVAVCFMLSCREISHPPKPRMYPRVDFPERNLKIFEKDYCNLNFEFPDYAEFVQDSFFFDEKPSHPCWFNLNIKSLNSVIHCSYYPISGQKSFSTLIHDVFNLAGKHNIKANYRKESLVENPENRVYGLIFNIEGPVASPIQFYMTDSTTHFFRGSLYINDKVNPDSTKIIVDFISEDINHMIETFKWK
jgi:gliding motility-associated lipoprotein GldD